jgi:hypothetical protein
MKSKIFLIFIAFLIALSAASCSGRSSGLDMKKFKEKMQQENNVSDEKKAEIRKSIFPNYKEKE